MALRSQQLNRPSGLVMSDKYLDFGLQDFATLIHETHDDSKMHSQAKATILITMSGSRHCGPVGRIDHSPRMPRDMSPRFDSSIPSINGEIESVLLSTLLMRNPMTSALTIMLEACEQTVQASQESFEDYHNPPPTPRHAASHRRRDRSRASAGRRQPRTDHPLRAKDPSHPRPHLGRSAATPSEK